MQCFWTVISYLNIQSNLCYWVSFILEKRKGKIEIHKLIVLQMNNSWKECELFCKGGTRFCNSFWMSKWCQKRCNPFQNLYTTKNLVKQNITFFVSKYSHSYRCFCKPCIQERFIFQIGVTIFVSDYSCNGLQENHE